MDFIAQSTLDKIAGSTVHVEDTWATQVLVHVKTGSRRRFSMLEETWASGKTWSLLSANRSTAWQDSRSVDAFLALGFRGSAKTAWFPALTDDVVGRRAMPGLMRVGWVRRKGQCENGTRSQTVRHFR